MASRADLAARERGGAADRGIRIGEQTLQARQAARIPDAPKRQGGEPAQVGAAVEGRIEGDGLVFAAVGDEQQQGAMLEIGNVGHRAQGTGGAR